MHQHLWNMSGTLRLVVVGKWHLWLRLRDSEYGRQMNRWHTQTHTHTHLCFQLQVEDSHVITGVFSSLFIWKLKCSQSTPCSTLVWLRRLSRRHTFQQTSTAKHTHTEEGHETREKKNKKTPSIKGRLLRVLWTECSAFPRLTCSPSHLSTSLRRISCAIHNHTVRSNN